ncbi:carbohydrate ABC transporter permease [Paracoccus litorisediminis]|uniref:ABC transporter permease subunit n=1 Tax=Paracoccus litorisediminis TaxID=2006130 RepID=A0A844HQL0_9RHOB|nr:sugar ABC transporter permease [Paracoccus litorisediminis]MTH62170.1 ABC transporter permease subunit [Paracoccus litorisediminis]
MAFEQKPKEVSFQQNWSAYAFLAPALVILFMSLLLPAAATLVMSFTDVSFLHPTNWVGFDNYIKLLADEKFGQAVANTIHYTLGVTFPTMALGMLAAVALNRKVPGRIAFRTIFYLPVLTSLIAAAVVWAYLYEPYAGPLNNALAGLGLTPRPWLQDPSLALNSLIVMAIWRDFGTAMIIYLAGLQDIPNDVYEAARLDGAPPHKIFFRITVPMLSSVTFYLLIILIVQTFQVFGAIYVMTQGGPLGSTETVVYQMYQTAFAHTEFGYGAAMSTVLFLTILAFSLIGTRIMKRKDG